MTRLVRFLRDLLACGIGGFLFCIGMAITASAETLAERGARLEPHMSIVLPDGAGPFPVVLMFHGCGGRRPMMEGWARAVNDAGAAAVIVDSYAHRGIGRLNALSTVCTGAQLRGRERAGDLYATYAWARRQTWADPNRIVAAGWSHGGWTILDALAMRPGAEMARATGLDDLPTEPLEGLAGAFFLYPYSGVASLTGKRDWRIAPTSLAIVGGRDLIVGTRTPMEALERQVARGAPIEIVLFESATHAFDDDKTGHPQVRYDPEATARAQGLLAGLLSQLD